MAIVNISLETALSIRLIPINAPIISGEAGGHWLIINIPRTKVPMPYGLAVWPQGRRSRASEGVVLLYYRAEDKGLWFLPGSGKGPLSASGRQMMKEAIDGRHSTA
jgi:hypothetical protein